MSFRIALVQFKPERRDVKTNIKKVQNLLNGITADLVVMPELANSGYLYENIESIMPYAEGNHGDGDFLSSLIDLAASIKGIIVAGYAELDGDHVFNSAAAVSEKGVIENYRKTHLYADEKVIFKPGNSGFKVFEWQGINIGMMICFRLDIPRICTHPCAKRRPNHRSSCKSCAAVLPGCNDHPLYRKQSIHYHC
jgi:predicted amidohydrolase